MAKVYYKHFRIEKNPLLRQAHPTLEHFLPIVVAGGVASKSDDNIKEVYNDSMLSLGWGVYQVGQFNNNNSSKCKLTKNILLFGFL